MTTASPAATRDAAALSLGRDGDGALVVTLAGEWRLGGTPSPARVAEALEARPPRLRFEATGLGRWDTGLALFVAGVESSARERGVAVERSGLPPGLVRILALADSAPGRAAGLDESGDPALFEYVGLTTLAAGEEINRILDFVGGVVLAVGRWILGRARYRRVDLVANLQQAGLEALPVVGLVSFLLGLILAFVGAIQLQIFDATIYTADLVGIAMVRDMAALMTAIVMAGRSGASYAAQLGTMQVNQEIDALTTLGISPLEYLVMPRVVALVLMLPLLTVYADVLGMLGGALVGVGILDLSPLAYYRQTVGAVSVTHLWGGLLKAATYGALVGMAGCFQGIRAERSSAGVGKAATTAVVNGIVLVISACGIYAVLFYFLGL